MTPFAIPEGGEARRRHARREATQERQRIHLDGDGPILVRAFECDTRASPTVLLVARTIVGRRGTGFARYATKFGADEAAVARYFVAEQERADLARRCSELIELDGEVEAAENARRVRRCESADALRSLAIAQKGAFSG